MIIPDSLNTHNFSAEDRDEFFERSITEVRNQQIPLTIRIGLIGALCKTPSLIGLKSALLLLTTEWNVMTPENLYQTIISIHAAYYPLEMRDKINQILSQFPMMEVLASIEQKSTDAMVLRACRGLQSSIALRR